MERIFKTVNDQGEDVFVAAINEIQADAFINSGFTEVEKVETTKKSK